MEVTAAAGACHFLFHEFIAVVKQTYPCPLGIQRAMLMDMSIEVASFTVKAGTEEQFLQVFRDQVVDLFHRAGARDIKVYRSQITPNRFVKVGEWKSREARLNDFVGSPLYPQFLALMGPFLDGPPSLDDYDVGYEE